MNKTDKKIMYQMLEKSIENYKEFAKRDDFPDRPCVRRNVVLLQGQAFHLIDMFYHSRWITFEEWCNYCCQIDLVFEDKEDCQYTNCGANIDGKCEYMIRNGGEDNARMESN